MRKTNKKGFTLVELLVVIAIVAILATVAIVGYTSFTNKANVSNDKTLVAQLNTAVTKADGKYTIHEAAELLRDHGFDISKIEATAKNNEILWDNTKGEFFYTEDGMRNDDIWLITDNKAKVNGDYSIYYVGTDDIDSNTVKNLIVYTNDAARVLNVTAENAHVVHEGSAGTINVLKVGPNSYVENGIVNELNVATARKVTISGQVASLTLTAGATVTLEAGSETVKVIVNNADVTITPDAEAVVGNIASEDETIASKLATDIVKGDVANDVIIDTAVNADELGDFAGGFGTAAFPYIIATPDQMANISKHYDTYNYYKVADGVTSLDLTGVGRIKLHGSFDGNGVSLVNLTTSLFVQVGYQNSVETIKISNLTATMNNTDGHAFVRNIFNAGTTTFENVTLHGYIEGEWNLGSFYNYGTVNYNGVGASYTVEFINSKSDMTIVCTSGNVAGGFLGNSYEGAGNSFTLKIDGNSAYTGKILTTNGKGNLYFTMTSDYNNALNHFIVNGEEIHFDNGNIPAADNRGTITVVAPVAGEDGYTVAPVAGAAKFVVSLNAQMTAYDEEGIKITNKSGMTWVLGKTEMDATDGKIFDLISNATIVNNASDTLGYTLVDGNLTIKSGRADNYASGWVTLQVAQYDANGNILAVGTVTVHTFAEPSAQ